MKKTINIIKHSGEIQEFNINKLINSLRRSRADESLIQDIAMEVQSQVKEGMTTKKIYQKAFKMLKNKARVSASRYKLKKAIMELGPSGFPFEKFVARILEQEGFKAKVGIIVQGHCVRHEIDVIALKDNEHYMIECKYHSDQGKVCNVKIPLYIQSRFIDVAKQWKKHPDHHTKIHQGWVYTNTRFTSDALQYGTCMGLGLVSWGYPKNNSLKYRIDRSGLHPLTSLTTLTKAEKSKLLDKGIVLCKEVSADPKLLEEAGVPKTRHKGILEDSQELCSLH